MNNLDKINKFLEKYNTKTDSRIRRRPEQLHSHKQK